MKEKIIYKSIIKDVIIASGGEITDECFNKLKLLFSKYNLGTPPAPPPPPPLIRRMKNIHRAINKTSGRILIRIAGKISESAG